MARTRLKVKGRRVSGSFVSLPHALLEHSNYAALSARAVKLLIDLYAQYRGKNNGDLCATLSVMKKRGWNSNDQITKARNELLQSGWIVQTKQGGLNLGPSLFAVTFQSIDECGGKLDCSATRTALAYWKLGYNPELKLPHRNTVQTEPPHGTVERRKP
ncbi:MAG: hypothetical protein V3U75_01830 [Methylococcaceae bacterium]